MTIITKYLKLIMLDCKVIGPKLVGCRYWLYGAALILMHESQTCDRKCFIITEAVVDF